MPVPATTVDRELYNLSDDRSQLSPNRMRHWARSKALHEPAAACLAAIVQAREEVNNALDRQRYHAGPQPEALTYWWSRVQNSVQRARDAALTAETCCAKSGDPEDLHRNREIWESIAQELAAAQIEARVQHAYWQGVLDTAPSPE